PVELPGTEDEVLSIGGELPEEGEGAPAAIAELARLGHATATRSAGPRFFHFVIGGATPGALAADWLTSSFDQNAGAWVGSPLASRLETVCLEWLRDLFQLPREFGGVLVTGGTVADLATERGAWLPVDGAFGLFARISPKASHLAAGVERARSVSSDGHKWLNVPHDCGFGFVRDGGRLAATFSEEAAYLPATDESRPSWGSMGPEGSRRARALTIWATLHAYGRSGYRAMVERHLKLAQRLATRVDEEPELERLAEVPLNIVCFRWRPLGESHHGLDDLNRRLGEALIRDGRVFAGTTVFEGKVAFRPAIVNWRTRPE